MSPIRVGLIGLSTATNPLQPGAWATMAHLPAILASPHYELVALCNSTVQSAKASIAQHKLPPNVKAYGSPEDLAQDPDVDLVVVSVQVGKHYMLAKPALLAGKAVFVEWPLGVNDAEVKELADLAKTKGVKTVMGLQARASPLVAKVKEVLDSGRIGKVMSTTIIGVFAGIPIDKFPADAAYYLNKNSGGNVLTVQLGHFLDTVHSLLGEPTSLHSLMTTQYPTIALIDASGTVVKTNHPKTTPDHVTFHGTLASFAPISLTFRSGASVDANGVHWLITGTEGEIEVVTPEMQWQLGPPGTKLRVRTKEAGLEEVAWEEGIKEEEHVSNVRFPGTNTARVYEAFATGEKGKYADFEDAVVRHRMIEMIAKSAT